MKNMDFRNAVFFNAIVTQKIEGTELLLARKKIILPERKNLWRNQRAYRYQNISQMVMANLAERLLKSFYQDKQRRTRL